MRMYVCMSVTQLRKYHSIYLSIYLSRETDRQTDRQEEGAFSFLNIFY